MRTCWALCVVLGAGVVVVVIWLAGIVPPQTCGGETFPFFAYQLSRTTADIEAVFGQENDACRARMVAALDLASKIYLVAFIVIYSGFLACFFLALRGYGYAGLARVGLILVVATFAFDVVHTLIQLRIIGSLPGPVASLVLLTITGLGKFLGVALAGLCAGGGMFARGGILARLAGAACVVAAFMVAVGVNYVPARPVVPLGLGLVFAIMLLYAMAAAVRRTSVSG
jgi:hypothetical protein